LAENTFKAAETMARLWA